MFRNKSHKKIRIVSVIIPYKQPAVKKKIIVGVGKPMPSLTMDKLLLQARFLSLEGQISKEGDCVSSAEHVNLIQTSLIEI